MSKLDCQHERTRKTNRVCTHLLANKDSDYERRFTGRGVEYELICVVCSSTKFEDIEFRNVCKECFDEIDERGYWESMSGIPEVLERSTNLHFVHENIDLDAVLVSKILDIQPIDSESASVWIALDEDGNIFCVDLQHRTSVLNASVPAAFWDAPCPPGGRAGAAGWPPGEQNKRALQISRDGKIAAVVNTKGRHGVVLDLTTGGKTMNLDRGDYHTDVSRFPVAFLKFQGRTLLIHASAWNRLDVSDPFTGELLTEREFPAVANGTKRPEHYLDYFHSSLDVSPDQKFVADFGWCWHPAGLLSVWDVFRWINENVWESEDGPSKKYFCQRWYYWDGPMCWLDNQYLAVWGYGADDEWLIPAVSIYDVTTGKLARFFAGPKGTLVFDKYLFSFCKEAGTSIWDVDSGERLFNDGTFCPLRYHCGAKCFLTILPDGSLQISRILERK